ncbi:MAG: adenylate/guanylate cyclase domain-containing protein [Desulfobacterales bacterium]|nr:adenylate/guanylate cyclase domain-containing protein [Desulfobacterales bacterium]MCP4160415.1 adenylate/guanylate cyclase domain-containing protein [Deltaproteobacteria bacterium]
MLNRKNRPIFISFIVVVFGIFIYFPPGISFFNLMELKTVDLRFISRGTVKPKNNIALVTVDEKSIDFEGRWPWDRKKMAKLITKISDGGAKVLGFDIGFFDPDAKIAVKTAEIIKRRMEYSKRKDPDLIDYVDNIIKEADSDTILSESIRKSKTKVVSGYFFHFGEDNSGHLSKEQKLIQKKNVIGSKIWNVRYDSEKARTFSFITSPFPEANIPSVSKATQYSGFFNMFVDQDGAVRKLPSIIENEKSLYAPLSLMILKAYKDQNIQVMITENYGVEEVRLGADLIPTDEFGRIMINYRGPSKTFEHISATDILRDRIKPGSLKDKILLIGVTAVGVYDLRITPFENNFPGLEIHANVVDSVLSKDYMYRPEWAAWFDIAAMVFGCIVLGIILAFSGSTAGAFAAIVMLTGHIVFCQYIFSSTGMILNIVYPVFTMILTYVSIVGYKYFIEEGQKRFIKGAFATYLAPSVVKQLLDQPEKLELGGQQREITAFFSDVEGFTKISEKLTATELVDLLNEFLTDMTDIILHHKGTVDKFEGDAIIAFFGAPNDLENQADTAVRASIDMQMKLVEKRAVWKKEGRDELKMRIGLCTGLAVVGNMGSASRMDYTMMGDTVNTAARLEGVNKIYGIYSLIGETTRERLADDIVVREIDKVLVVGKTESITIYEIIGYKKNLSKDVMDGLRVFKEAIEKYREGDFSSADDLFNKVLAFLPDDGPSKTFMKRCADYKENPPDDWEGIYSMQTK